MPSGGQLDVVRLQPPVARFSQRDQHCVIRVAGHQLAKLPHGVVYRDSRSNGRALRSKEMSIRKRREAAAARAELEAKMIELDAAERRASQSEANLKRIIQYAPDVITVNRYSDGRFMLVNREFSKDVSMRAQHSDIRPLKRSESASALNEKAMKELAQNGVSRDIGFEIASKTARETLSRLMHSCRDERGEVR